MSTGERVAQVAALFDGLAEQYDQTGVPYYALIARGLVDRLDVRPGERALDVGAGRGAATFPLAAAVGEGGHVDAIDVAPGMVERLAADAADLPQVRVCLGDASDPRPGDAPYDVVAASLVVFFLPDPQPALARWRALMRSGGRLGIATFQPWSGAWRELADLQGPSAAPHTAFDDDAGVEGLLTGAGYGGVRTETVTHRIAFADVGEWERWSRAGTVMGGIWNRTDERDHPEIRRRAAEILGRTRGEDGRLWLEVDARYTFGRA